MRAGGRRTRKAKKVWCPSEQEAASSCRPSLRPRHASLRRVDWSSQKGLARGKCVRSYKDRTAEGQQSSHFPWNGAGTLSLFISIFPSIMEIGRAEGTRLTVRRRLSDRFPEVSLTGSRWAVKVSRGVAFLAAGSIRLSVCRRVCVAFVIDVLVCGQRHLATIRSDTKSNPRVAISWPMAAQLDITRSLPASCVLHRSLHGSTEHDSSDHGSSARREARGRMQSRVDTQDPLAAL